MICLRLRAAVERSHNGWDCFRHKASTQRLGVENIGNYMEFLFATRIICPSVILIGIDILVQYMNAIYLLSSTVFPHRGINANNIVEDSLHSLDFRHKINFYL